MSCVNGQDPLIQPKEILVESGTSSLSDYYIFQFELTVDQYKRYLQASGEKFDFNDWVYYDGPLNKIITNDDCPMANVTILETVKFANWLSKQYKLNPAYQISFSGKITQKDSTNGFRLPTSKEWEWAAKGGIRSKGYKYPGSDILDEVAWYNKNSDGLLHPVGMKRSNELEIYDLFGNAEEWCWDQYYIVEKSLNKHEEYKLPNGGYAIPYTKKEQRTDLSRLGRGGYSIMLEKWFEYNMDFNLAKDEIGAWRGIRLVRSVK